MPPEPMLVKMTQGLRRGSLSLAVLATLGTPRHAYALRKHMADRGLSVDEGTLYPLVRRLEKDGLLDSQWQEEAGRKRRIYQRSALGDQLLESLWREWQQLEQALQQLHPGAC